jgi:hypothetical protein
LKVVHKSEPQPEVSRDMELIEPDDKNKKDILRDAFVLVDNYDEMQKMRRKLDDILDKATKCAFRYNLKKNETAKVSVEFVTE